ncbi:MAG: hypothetical protein HY094_04550 [Candidatus Melainabacteria bacterium]|nr:hypothetical protein [Candidatus Melainabacteria bacterium]
MKIFKVSSHLGAVGTVALGLASIIKSASADDQKKVELPNLPKQVQLGPLDVPKLVEKKIPLSDNLIDQFIDIFKDLTEWNTPQYELQIKTLHGLPQEIKVQIAKRAFSQATKALKDNVADLKDIENKANGFVQALSMKEPLLKNVLANTKNEYQELIGAYLQALSDKGNKREQTSEESASWNSWILERNLLKPNVLDSAPPGLFNKKWYPQIEKILERTDNEFTAGGTTITSSLNSVIRLAILESRKDSGIKEPKVYKNLPRAKFIGQQGVNINEILVACPEKVRAEIVGKIFTETSTALKNNDPDLRGKEAGLYNFLQSISSTSWLLKSTLEGAKNEYQELIGAYLQALSDKENKREKTSEQSAYWNSLILGNYLLRSEIISSAPPSLFSKKWYPQIEKILERIDKEFTSTPPFYTKASLVQTIAKIATLEHRKDSGVKEPRLYNDLIKLTNKNLEDNFPLFSNSLEEFIKNEAIVNDRDAHTGSLIQPYEKIIQQILANPPSDDATEKQRSLHISAYLRAQMLTVLFNRFDCLEVGHDLMLRKLAETISKANIENIPELVNRFGSNFEPSNFLNQELYEKIANSTKKHLTPLLDTEFKNLLDENCTKHEAAAQTILAIRDLYPRSKTFYFRRNEYLSKKADLILEHFQNNELKDKGAVRSYVDLLKVILEEDNKSASTLKCFNHGLHTQIDFSQKAMQKAQNLQEVRDHRGGS